MEHIGRALTARRKRGFTMIEILIVAPVLLLLITFMGSVLINMYGNVVVESHKVLLRAEAQQLASILKSDLEDTVAFTSSIDRSVYDENEPDDRWNYNTKPPTLISRSLLYDKSTDGTKGTEPMYRKPHCVDQAVLNRVYYTAQNDFNNYRSLFRRIIAPTQDNLCSESSVATTCPASRNSPQCKPDELLNDRIESLSITYFDEQGNELLVYDATLDTAPESARSALISLTLSEVAYGKTVKESAEVMVRRDGR